MNELVSIVIPCFNAASYVEDAVRSSLSQTYRPLELFCIDDGSSDDTLGVLQRLRDEAPEVITVVRQENAGACVARNRGLRLAQGDYVQFLDADDLLLPEKIAFQINLARRMQEPGLIVGSYLKKLLVGKEVEYVARPVNPWVGLPHVKLGTTTPNLFKKDLLLAIGGWKEGLKSSQEYDLMFRMLKHGCRVAFDQEIHTVVRQQAASITSTNLEENDVRRIRQVAEIREYVRRNIPSAEALHAADTALFDVIRSLCNRNLDRGIGLFDQYFADDYQPVVTGGTTPGYVTAYRFLGFRRAERLRFVLRRLRTASAG